MDGMHGECMVPITWVRGDCVALQQQNAKPPAVEQLVELMSVPLSGPTFEAQLATVAAEFAATSPAIATVANCAGSKVGLRHDHLSSTVTRWWSSHYKLYIRTACKQVNYS